MTSNGKAEGLQGIVILNAALSNEGREVSSAHRGRVQSRAEAPPTQRQIDNELLAHLSRVGPQKWEMFWILPKNPFVTSF